MLRLLLFRSDVHHPAREGLQEGPEARQVLGGKAELFLRALQDLAKASKPRLASFLIDLEGEVAHPHARWAESLREQRRTAHDLYEEGRRLGRSGPHVGREEVSHFRLLQLDVERLEHAEDRFLAHGVVELPGGRVALGRTTRRGEDRLRAFVMGHGRRAIYTLAAMSSDQTQHELLRREYGLQGALSRLPGENENYLLTAQDGRRFVLKITGEEFGAEFLAFEDSVVEAVHASDIGLAVPRIVRTATGQVFADLEDGARRARLLEFVEGTAWLDSSEVTGDLRREFGRVLARLTRVLADVDSGPAERSHGWDLCAANQHRRSASLVESSEGRRVLEQAFHGYSALAEPRLAALPRQLIHGDANHENILIEGQRLVGLLDFGDCLVNPRICELAIALAYVMLGEETPLACAAEVVAGFHAELPLEHAEFDVLFPLVCGRLAVSVAVSAERRQLDPNHPSWFDTEESAWSLLQRLTELEPAAAANELARETGFVPYPKSGASVDELLERRGRHISRALSISYSDPLKIVRGRGQYLIDHQGRPFLDLVNNVCHVGHCHPHVVAAGQAQLATLNTNTRYLYDGLVDYAERLCATLPAELDTCFFLNSGSEANELALRLARTHTGRRDLLVVDGAYHGHTGGLIEISPYKFMGKGGRGRAEPWVHVVPIADGYRGVHKGKGASTGRAYGDEVGDVVARLERPPAAFIAESLLGCGGQVIPPRDYFKTAYHHVREAGGVCIADEVQVGFGRVGSHFWAFESQEVVPDIVVMGKPIGNGHPLAAVVTTRAIAESFENGMEFFATFGGNPVACAIGMAVLDVIEDEGLQEHARTLGAHMLNGLKDLMSQHPIIGEVRGLGLFVGVEFVEDRESLKPAKREATEFVERMKARGMLLSTDGPHGNVIKIKPPLVLHQEDVEMFLRSFDDVLTEMEK